MMSVILFVSPTLGHFLDETISFIISASAEVSLRWLVITRSSPTQAGERFGSGSCQTPDKSPPDLSPSRRQSASCKLMRVCSEANQLAPIVTLLTAWAESYSQM